MGVPQSARYIEFTDVSGQRRRYAVDVTKRIGTVRPDGTKETDIFYTDDSFGVQSNRADGSGEVFVQYENSMINQIQTHRPDGTEEAEIAFRDGRIESVKTNRDDESTEAMIAYNRGRLQSLSSVRKNASMEAVMTFENGVLKRVEVPDSIKLDIQ